MRHAQRRRLLVPVFSPLADFLAARLPALPAPLHGVTALVLAAGFLAGLLAGELMGWAWRGVVAAGFLGSAAAWAGLREAEFRQARAVLRAMPCHAVVVGPDRRPLWQTGSGLGFAGGAGEGREEERLKMAHWHLPTQAREAEVNAGLAAHLRADGSPQQVQDAQGRWFELRHLRLPRGQTVCFSTDITEARRREAALLTSEARLHALLERAPVGLWELDSQGRTRFANARLRRLFLGEVPPAFDAAALLAEESEGGLPRPTPGEGTEVALPLPDGREVPVLVSVAPWRPASWSADPEAGDAEGRLLSLLDLSALKAAQARVAHLTEHDALTGLANRAAFQAGLGAMTADPQGGLLLLVDLDHFAATNDRFGHAVGDALLRETAARLRAALRPSDLICRLGADEFAILAFKAGQQVALTLAGRVRAALRPPLQLDGIGLRISASIGIAAAPQHGEEAGQLLRAADLALTEAKEMGRNAVSVFEPAMRERSEQRALLREAFAAALEAGELELHIQPQRDLERGRVVGAEALIRWNSSRLGRWVSPAEMLPAAAEAGLLQRLDRFVLHRAVALLAAWEGQAGAPPCLGINISVTTLHDAGFAEEVRRALAAAGVEPQRLEIEIPEDLAIRDLPAVQKTLQALREVGVPLALDDFGGGHSGLPHVVRLPVQRLKLDRSIVAELPDDPKAIAVLRATMALARGMGIEVVGEGVETEAQAAALRQAGCQVIQGWLIARPMPAEAFLATAHPAVEALPARRARA